MKSRVACALVAAVVGFVPLSGLPAAAQTINFNSVLRSLGNAIEESARQNRPAAAPQSQSRDQFDRSTRRRIQGALNALGYDAGPEDGIFGARTRDAIRAYQAATGLAQTGALTPEQADTLLSRPAGASQAVASAASSGFEVLTGYDLPGNDYAHSGTSSALKGVAADGCQAACAADSMCRAYTFNTEANWCFLKTDSGVPTAFQGAVSGRKLEAAVQPARNGFAADLYRPAGADDRFDIELELARRAIFTRPDLLDSDDTVSRWVRNQFNERAYGAGRAQATDDTVKFYSGTSFDRRDAITNLRQTILATATDEPMRFRIRERVLIRPGAFVEGKGVPVHFRGEGNYQRARASLGETEIHMDYLGGYAKFYFDDAPDIGYIPADEARARELAELVKDNQYNRMELVLYVTLGSLGNVQEEDAFSSLVADSTLDAAEIVIHPRSGSQISETQSIYLWDLTRGSGPAGDPQSVAAYANWIGLPLKDGRLVRYENLDSRYLLYNEVDVKKNTARWLSLQSLAQLAHNPALLDDTERLLAYASGTLSEVDKRTVSRGKNMFGDRWGSRPSLDVFSEFERGEVLADLRENYTDRILARTPPFPLPILEIKQARLGEYDFEKQEFPIIWNDSDSNQPSSPLFTILGSFYGGDAYVLQTVVSNLRSFPDALPVPPDEARALAEQLESIRANSGRRIVYFAAFASTGKPEMANDLLTYDVSVERAAMFADFDLTQLIREFPISDGWEDADTAGDETDAQGPKPEIVTGAMPLTLDNVYLWLAKTQPDLLDDEAFMQNALKHRRAAELEGAPDTLHVGSYLPRLVLNDLKLVDSNDRDMFRQRYAELAEEAEFARIRIPGGVQVEEISGGEVTIDLDRFLTRRSIQHSERLDVARAHLPQAYDVYEVIDDHEVPVVIATMAEADWYGLRMPRPDTEPGKGDRFDGYVDLDVQSMVVGLEKNGDPVVVIGVTPHAVVLRNSDGSEIRHEIDHASLEPRADNPDYAKVDIWGARLGMTLEEAAAAIAAGSDDPMDSKAISGTTPDLTDGMELWADAEDGKPKVHFGLFTGSGELEGRVIAISSVQRFDGEIDRDAIREALVAKYGEPGEDDDMSPHWIVNEDSNRRLNGRIFRSGCDYSPGRLLFVPFYVNSARDTGGSAAYIELGEASAGCGVVLLAGIGEQDVTVVMVDSDAALAFREERRTALAEAAEREKEQRASGVKF